MIADTVLAISASYVILVLVGHGVMRLVAGPARADRLAQRPWEAAER
jgi:exosortase/archaeosortase